MKQLSIIIPAYNEEKAIAETIKGLEKELTKINLEYEIIVVNDASTDKTKEVLEKIENIKLINHPYNKGYGASLKTGVKEAKFNNLLFFDADGQHPADKIAEFLEYSKEFDLMAGDRTKGKYKGPFIRLPGKKLLNIIANYLTGMKIPDLNCGFRIVKKNEILKFLHIMPEGFSFSATTTLAFIKEGLSVKFIPVEVKKRIGKSLVKPKDAFRMLLLILRIVLLFSPFKVFLPISGTFFVFAFISGIYDLFFRPLNLTDITILLFISSLLIFCFGLLADQVAAIRREIKS